MKGFPTADGELDAECAGLDEFRTLGFQLNASRLYCHMLFYKFLADGAWVAEWKIVWEVCVAVCVFCGPEARHCLLSPVRDPGNHS